MGNTKDRFYWVAAHIAKYIKAHCLNDVFALLHDGKMANSSRKHLRTKVTPDFHLTYSKNGGNLVSESK